MLKKSNYMFTNKKRSDKALISIMLGLVSLISLFLVIYFTFQLRGEAKINYGVATILSALFSLAGIWQGISARMEKDRFHLYAYLGILFNGIAVIIIGFIAYVGINGL